MERSQLAPRTFELILKSIERHERLLNRDYPKSPQLPDFPNFRRASSLVRLSWVTGCSMKPQKNLHTNFNLFDHAATSVSIFSCICISDFNILFFTIY